MNIILISSLLETLKISVWPPGSNIYLGECVLLRCSVESSLGSAWSYRWFKHQSASTPNPRHRVSGDSYSITAVTGEDAGRYRCQAKRWESNTSSVELLSQPAVLSVSELPPPSLLTLTPSSRQLYRGERFTVRCPSGWMLRQWSDEQRAVRKSGGVLVTDRCSPLGGAVAADKLDACTFTAIGGSSGLYWCEGLEGPEGRSNAVNLTVSNGTIILKTPASPVFEGDKVVLYCQYWTGNHSRTTFFKNGAEVDTYSSSSSDGVINMTIENVTRRDEGFYKCASRDGKMESPESWLSVRPDAGSWKWIIVSCGIIPLVLIPLTVWLLRHHRCWPFSKENLPAAELPATKQDVTEVQWDLSWMEMSHLLDRQLYPVT
ncbi:high affinity immunoglobulin gamma Fc receptor I-like [Anarhichas minor]|uniref:high affinity immunoglobulin gamma Fc receptor I-like n=1 Tax=Anarhichas minor TaxID=65739 RepID=UPI003F7318FF